MGLGGLDILRRRVDAGHIGAEPRQRLAHEPAAAADIEHAQAGEARRPLGVAAESAAELVADIGQAQRVDAVERPEGTALVPPLPGEPGEPCDFLGVEGPRRI